MTENAQAFLRLQIIDNKKESQWRWVILNCPICGKTDHIHGGGLWNWNVSHVLDAGHRISHCYTCEKGDYNLIPTGVLHVRYCLEKYNKKRHATPFYPNMADYIAEMQSKMELFLQGKLNYWEVTGRRLKPAQVDSFYNDYDLSKFL